MKKIFRTIMVLSVASLGVLSSCKKDSTTSIADPVTGVISVTAKNTTSGIQRTLASGGLVYADDSVVITVTCTGNSSNELKTVTLKSDNPAATLLNAVAISGTSASKSAAWIVNGSGNVTFTSTVTGATGDPSTSTFVVKITLISSSNATLGNQANINPKFWASSTGLTYFLKNVSDSPALASKMDFAYCSRTAGNKIISPSSQDATDIYATQWSATAEKITTWNHRNVTVFKLVTNITQTDVQNANGNPALISDLIAKALTGGEPTADNVSVLISQIYVFKTEAGKYGIISINNASGGVNGGTATDGYADLVVMYQK